MTSEFYDVKAKKKVKTTVTAKKEVKNGTGTTFMLKGVTKDGRSLTRFVSKSAYDSAVV